MTFAIVTMTEPTAPPLTPEHADPYYEIGIDAGAYPPLPGFEPALQRSVVAIDDDLGGREQRDDDDLLSTSTPPEYGAPPKSNPNERPASPPASSVDAAEDVSPENLHTRPPAYEFNTAGFKACLELPESLKTLCLMQHLFMQAFSHYVHRYWILDNSCSMQAEISSGSACGFAPRATTSWGEVQRLARRQADISTQFMQPTQFIFTHPPANGGKQILTVGSDCSPQAQRDLQFSLAAVPQGHTTIHQQLEQVLFATSSFVEPSSVTILTDAISTAEVSAVMATPSGPRTDVVLNNVNQHDLADEADEQPSNLCVILGEHVEGRRALKMNRWLTYSACLHALRLQSHPHEWIRSITTRPLIRGEVQYVAECILYEHQNQSTDALVVKSLRDAEIGAIRPLFRSAKTTKSCTCCIA